MESRSWSSVEFLTKLLYLVGLRLRLRLYPVAGEDKPLPSALRHRHLVESNRTFDKKECMKAYYLFDVEALWNCVYM